MGGQVTKGGRGRTDGWVDGQKALGGEMEKVQFMEWTEKTGQMAGGRMVGEAHDLKMSWYTGLNCGLFNFAP